MSNDDLAVAEACGLNMEDWLRWMYDQNRLRITPGPDGGPPIVEIIEPT